MRQEAISVAHSQFRSETNILKGNRSRKVLDGAQSSHLSHWLLCVNESGRVSYCRSLSLEATNFYSNLHFLQISILPTRREIICFSSWCAVLHCATMSLMRRDPSPRCHYRSIEYAIAYKFRIVACLCSLLPLHAIHFATQSIR